MLVTQRSRRQHAQAPGDHGRHVTEDIAEHVLGEDHVELARLPHQLHGGIVHVHIIQRHTGVFLCHLMNHIPPKLGALQYIGFMDRSHLASPFQGQLHSHPGNAFHLISGIDQRVPAPLIIIPPGLSEIDAAGELPHHHQIRVGHNFLLQRGSLDQRSVYLGRPQVGEQAQFFPQSQQCLLGSAFGRQAVPLGATHRPQQNCVGRQAHLQSGLIDGPAMGFDGRPADGAGGHLKRHGSRGAHMFQYRQCRLHHFGPDAVAR